ncbi:MAG TPA: amidohydrolase family protein [Pseudomonadales bacterium]
MLIRAAEVFGHPVAPIDVRLRHGRIEALGRLTPGPGEPVLDAGGGALLPGLHDHHIHLMAYAASLGSVRCGPPEVHTAAELEAALAGAAAGGDGWIRGIGYHEHVAGDIDRHWLDAHAPDRPVRIQHRSGRLWIVNSRGLERLAAACGPWADDGRLFDRDEALRAAIGASLPPLAAASERLARYGVTGVTDMTAHNGPDAFAALARLEREGAIRQRLRIAGAAELTTVAGRTDAPDDGPTVGETKIHLHESALPPFDAVVAAVRRSHADGRGIAVHCVTEAELVFALAALREAGARAGDRIEHASVTPPVLLEQIRALGLTVVTQPNFVTERGDAYRTDVPETEHGWLYRGRAFLDAGVPLAGGTDAPFGDADPWRAMHAAVTRRTGSGAVLGEDERLTPEQALALFLGASEAPAAPRRIEPGAIADLCLLDVPWAAARESLSAANVRATIVGGRVIWQRLQPG